MKKFLIILCLAIFSCSQESEPILKQIPAGTYTIDKNHASLIFRVNHLGMSNYTARFKRFDATLQFNPADPASASVVATIDPASIETNFSEAKPDFKGMLKKEQWLDVAKFPKIEFSSSKVEIVGPNKGRITGNLTLHGVTLPVVLKVKFNGGYAGNPFDPKGSRIGFSAHGSFNRSDFGMGFGVPEKGSKMGVGYEVDVIIEAEFTRPKSESDF